MPYQGPSMIAGVAPETCREVVMTLGVKKLSHEKLSIDAAYLASLHARVRIYTCTMYIYACASYITLICVLVLLRNIHMYTNVVSIIY